ncbi:hypothetical protein H6P81_000301 [Aristolochia fimbriata]|uniref:Mitochondrial arginine transporter BAC2 n=1 Tax=Aristolochia fimbriata TaxID=158543 RepID=A0AAV7F890_ARIFI|nr:hypothetical protein H6P81_000301 [Aristolochia fimbriata]
MEFWPEFLASSWGREFIAGGVGGMAGVIAGHPLDTLKIRLQQPSNKMPAFKLFRSMLVREGPSSLYRGMGTPLASVAFQNAVVFQVFAKLSQACEQRKSTDPPSLRSVAIGGVGTGGLQSIMLSPVELVKIRLQLPRRSSDRDGPISLVQNILRREGIRGVFRGLGVTMLRDMPGHGTYFWTYEYTREWLHPGCRKSGQESVATMLVAGGWAGVASWLCCYPLDVVKSRLQAQSHSPGERSPPKYNGIVDCFRKSVREEGYQVLWRGLGTTIARAFVVNGSIFVAYESALRFLSSNNRMTLEENEIELQGH